MPDAYTGTVMPGIHTEGYVLYALEAHSATDVSDKSALKYFRLSPP
jgi:hypothetical protein